MPVEDTPDDDDVRQSYNFAPGYHGLVYRADGSDHRGNQNDKEKESEGESKEGAEGAEGAEGDTKYKLQSMQWGTSGLFTSGPTSLTPKVSFHSGRSATPTMAAR